MLKFYSLYSGSTGNSLLLKSENCNILIDSGVSAKKVVDALEQVNTPVTDINAILVTHEHTDHVQSLGTISKKYNIPVYANKKTWEAMKTQKDKIEDANIKYFTTNEKFEIEDISIHSFSIPHDAADPCGFNFTLGKEKFSVATDIGHMTTNIIDSLENSNFLMLEANYEPEVLKCSSYPYPLKTRIAGPNGHLSNQLAGKTIAKLIESGLEEVMLGHLSKENNFPELALKSVLEELNYAGYNENSVKIEVASRTNPVIPLLFV
jgi:phosphoribosyl 1,2-cyclic phosphodiesterase